MKTTEVPAIIAEAKALGCENADQINGYLAAEVSKLRARLAKDRGSEKRIPEPTTGAELIYNERLRHDTGELYDAAYDAQHKKGELAYAGASYAILGASQSVYPSRDVRAINPPTQWPWPGRKWKPENNRLKNLARAGALIAAEMDRLIAAGEKMPEEPQAQPPADLGLKLNPPV